MVDYDELMRAMDVLYICARMVERGLWTGNRIQFSLHYDDFYEAVLDALYCCCENVYADYKEETEVSSYYFSDPCMTEYYRLCREYSRRRGLKLKDNPYMLRAERFVSGQLSGPYTCWHTLHTKTNHKCAAGIHFMHDCYFGQELELLERMLDIVQFFEDGVLELKADLAKSTALAIIYPLPVRKEAA